MKHFSHGRLCALGTCLCVAAILTGATGGAIAADDEQVVVQSNQAPRN